MSRDPSDDATRGDDADIEALFDAQAERQPVPPELDASILAAARAASVADGAHAARSVRESPAAPAVAVRPWTVSRWLGAAAVLALAATLVPLLRQAPESARTAAESAAAPPDALPVAPPMAPVAEPESAAPEARLAVRSAAKDVSSGTSASSYVDHATPAGWLARIRERLRVEGPTKALREEYAAFRQRHPDIEPEFDFEKTARESAAERR